MQHTDKMRAEFERTSARDLRRQPPKGNNYVDPMAQTDWLAFQKGWEQSRAALVVELTGITILEHNGCDFYEKAGLCRAVEAAGVTVKE